MHTGRFKENCVELLFTRDILIECDFIVKILRKIEGSLTF